MNALQISEPEITLPALIDRATSALAGARSAAEVLEAKVIASVAYDAAKRAGRLAKAKDAHESIHAAALRSQADASAIIAAAQHRLADEYDAAQARGEVAVSGDTLKRGPGVPEQNAGKATAAEVGLSRKDIHEARIVRDAELARPGIVRQALDGMLERGEEPTRAALGRTLRELSAPSPSKPRAETGEAFARFLNLVDQIEAIGVRDLLVAAGARRSQLGQRASGLAEMMSDVMEGCAR